MLETQIYASNQYCALVSSRVKTQENMAL